MTVGPFGATSEFSAAVAFGSAPVIEFSSAATSVVEHAGEAPITIRRSAPLDASATIEVVSADGSARAGTDYLSVRTVLMFQPGQTTLVARVGLLDDAEPEAPETVQLSVRVIDGATPGAVATTTLTIIDDDGEAVAIPTTSMAGRALLLMLVALLAIPFLARLRTTP